MPGDKPGQQIVMAQFVSRGIQEHRLKSNTRVTSRQLVCPMSAQLEQSELLPFRAATPAYMHRGMSLCGDGCHGTHVSRVQRQLDVETRQHIQQEVPIPNRAMTDSVG